MPPLEICNFQLLIYQIYPGAYGLLIYHTLVVEWVAVYEDFP